MQSKQTIQPILYPMFDIKNVIDATELNLSEETWENIDACHSFGDTEYSLIAWDTLVEHLCPADYERLSDKFCAQFISLNS